MTKTTTYATPAATKPSKRPESAAISKAASNKEEVLVRKFTPPTVAEEFLAPEPMPNITELVFILDRSGSMQGLEKDTIGGFNSLIESQKEETGACFVTTFLFDDKVEHLYEQVPLGRIEPLTSKQYFVRGCTALLDAIGETIKKVNTNQKRKKGRPDKTIFVITTDGMENASHKFNLKQVRDLIEKRKNKNGWEFIFLGANIDAVETAGTFGISPQYAADFDASEEGLAKMYGAVKCAVSCLRCDKDFDEDWKASLKKD